MTLLFSNDLTSAFLTEIVRTFQQHHGNHYLGRTAMQKLAYFSQVVGVPIPCSFEIYNFGPYSDTITFSVESMIADDLIQDISTNPKYSNYRLKPGAPQFSPEIASKVDSYKQKIANVVHTLGKFDPPQLEVLATLHFIAAKIRSLGGDSDKETVMNQFFKVKRDKFSVDEVSSWYEALKTVKLV
jgi:uncharacterized protein YwgA